MPSKLPNASRLQRRVLTAALLSALAMPAYAGTLCQLVDASGALIPIDGSASGADALACGPRAKATGDRSVALGDEATASGKNATAVGSWIDLDSDGAVDPDEITWAGADGATALGAAAQAAGKSAVAVGVQSRAATDNSVAVGNRAQSQAQTTTTTKTTVQGTPNTVTTTTSTAAATGSGSIAMGSQARANGSNDIALGTGATVEKVANTLNMSTTNGVSTLVQTTTAGPAQNAMAIGNAARANGDGAIVIGAGAFAEAKVGQQLTGFGSTSNYYVPGPATNSTVIGTGARSQGVNSVVIGAGAQTSGDGTDPSGTKLLKDQNNVVIGNSAASVRGWGTAMGYNAVAYGYQTTAIGTYTYAVGPNSTAVGGYLDYDQAFGAAPRNPSFGPYGRTVATGLGAQAFGSGGYAWGNYDTTVGPGASTGDRDSAHPSASGQVTAQYSGYDPTVINASVSMGFLTKAAGHASVAIGDRARTNDAMAIAIGAQSVAWGIDSIALGDKALATWHEDVAIGKGAQTWGGFGTSNTALGVGAHVGFSGGADISNALAIGSNAEAMADGAVAVGQMASASGYNAVATGNASQAMGVSSSAYGDGSQAMGEYASALGAFAYAGSDYAAAVGTNAFALGAGSSAFGYNSIALEDDSVAIGAYSVADRANTVSVGSLGAERQIANVADGTDDMDAVNKRQLDSALIAAGASSAAQMDRVAAALGGGALLGTGGILGMPSYAIQGGRFGNVGDAFAAVDGSLTAFGLRLNQLEYQYANSGPVMGTGNGLAIGAGSHAQDGADTAIGTGAVVNADGSTALGNNSTISAAATNSVAVGADSNVSAASGTAIGQGASVTAEGAVALGQGSVANEANTVSVGSASQQRRVTNVAAGTAATDASNVGQMQAGDAATLASANTYTDTTATQTLTKANTYTDSRLQALDDQFTNLSNDIGYRLGKQDERIDRQGAMSAAMMNMAINAANSRSPRGRVAVGAGWQNGESAMSVGYSKSIGERASFSIGGAFSSDDNSVGAGFGIDL